MRDDVAQSHLACNLDAMHLELAGDLRGGGGHLGMAHVLDVLRVFSQQRDYRHQVGLAGAVVADNELRLVVGWLVELKLIKNDRVDAFGHLIGNHIILDEAQGLIMLIGKAQLNH